MTIPCHRCNGTGFEPDPKTIGETMRRLRNAAGLSLKVVGERCGYSAAYLSDMELGRRMFGAAQIKKFKEAIHGVDKR